MDENEYPIRVPLVDRTNDSGKIIGEAEIDADGNTMLNITDPEYAWVLQPPAYSLYLPQDAEDHIVRGTD